MESTTGYTFTPYEFDLLVVRSAAIAAQEGDGLQSVGGRVCHHTAQTGHLRGPHEEVEGEEDNGNQEY